MRPDRARWGLQARPAFASLDAMERLLAMGMQEGLAAALGQLDLVLTDLRDYAASFPTALEVVDVTHAVVTREVRGTLTQVWRCHHESALMTDALIDLTSQSGSSTGDAAGGPGVTQETMPFRAWAS